MCVLHFSGTLFFVSGLAQKYQKCHLVCQINGPVILFSHIGKLVGAIVCYMEVMGTMKLEQITKLRNNLYYLILFGVSHPCSIVDCLYL